MAENLSDFLAIHGVAPDPVDTFLAHHGVKGMKWGVHKQAISAGGYRGTGVVRVYGNLSAKEGAALASLAANSHVYDKKLGPKVQSDLKAINAKYDSKKFSNDAYYAKYRAETRAMYEKHLQASLPSGLTGVIMSHPNLDRPGYVVIGNKAGVDQEMKSLKGEGFKHSSEQNVLKLALSETKDADGYITNIAMAGVKHSDPVGDFLAHNGVKK